MRLIAGDAETDTPATLASPPDPAALQLDGLHADVWGKRGVVCFLLLGLVVLLDAIGRHGVRFGHDRVGERALVPAMKIWATITAFVAGQRQPCPQMLWLPASMSSVVCGKSQSKAVVA